MTPRYEIHDNHGLVIQLSDEAMARMVAAAFTREGDGYATVWLLNPSGCPNDLIGHAARGTFCSRPPCGGRA